MAASKEREVGIGRVEVTVRDKSVNKLLTVAWAERHSETGFISSSNPGLSKGIQLAASTGVHSTRASTSCSTIVSSETVHCAIGRWDLDVGGAVGEVAVRPSISSGL